MMLTKTKIHSFVLRLATVSIVLIVTASCGGGSSSNGAGNVPFQSANSGQQALAILQADGQLGSIVGGSWTLDDIVFKATFDVFTTQNSRSDSVGITTTTGIIGTGNSDYSYASLEINLSSNGSGDYVITDASSARSMFVGGANVASIEAIVASVAGNLSQWGSTVTSGTLVVSVNADGRYFVSTREPIVVTKTSDIGGAGVVGLPDQISLTILNVNAMPE